MPSSAVQKCALDRKSTRLNSSHTIISYAVFCLKKNNTPYQDPTPGRHATYTDLRESHLPHPPTHSPDSWLLPLCPPLLSIPSLFFFFLKDGAPPNFPPFPPPAPFRS